MLRTKSGRLLNRATEHGRRAPVPDFSKLKPAFLDRRAARDFDESPIPRISLNVLMSIAGDRETSRIVEATAEQYAGASDRLNQCQGSNEFSFLVAMRAEISSPAIDGSLSSGSVKSARNACVAGADCRMSALSGKRKNAGENPRVRGPRKFVFAAMSKRYREGVLDPRVGAA